MLRTWLPAAETAENSEQGWKRAPQRLKPQLFWRIAYGLKPELLGNWLWSHQKKVHLHSFLLFYFHFIKRDR
jgi:hypothetical protein